MACTDQVDCVSLGIVSGNWLFDTTSCACVCIRFMAEVISLAVD